MAGRYQHFIQTTRVCATCGKLWYLKLFNATLDDPLAMVCDACKKSLRDTAPATVSKQLPPCLCYFCQQREDTSANSSSER